MTFFLLYTSFQYLFRVGFSSKKKIIITIFKKVGSYLLFPDKKNDPVPAY